MRTGWLALLLVPCALAGDPKKEIALPAVSSVSSAPAPTLTVILTKEGGLFLPEGATPVSLDVLGKALAASAKGTVLVRADGAAPWQHVQWVLASCTANRIDKVRFCARKDGVEGVVDSAGPSGVGAPGAKVVLLRVHVVARKEIKTKIGGLAVQVPTESRYRSDGRETADVQDVAEWAREKLKTAKDTGAVLDSRIDAGHKVPFAAVLVALDAIRGAGVEHVGFNPAKAPDADQQRAVPLPYPARNYDD